MSREARDWAWQQGEERTISEPVDLLILLDLADVADEYGRNSYPSRERLAKHCMASERTITRHLAGLVESGHITVEAPATRIKPTTYRLNLGRQSVTPTDESGDDLGGQSVTPSEPETPDGVPLGCHWGDTPLRESARELELELKPTTKDSRSTHVSREEPSAPRGAKPTDDPVKRCAHGLAVKAMERTNKPKNFAAAMSVITSMLKAGWSDQQLLEVITGRDRVVFTVAGMQAALEAVCRERKAKANGGRPRTEGELIAADRVAYQEAQQRALAEGRFS